MPKEKQKYISAVGRRKTAVASARIMDGGSAEFVVNGRTMSEYFPTLELQKICLDALKESDKEKTFGVSVLVRGGGVHAQAEAVRHAIARALVKYDAELRKDLKKEGYLKRDPRSKERKKFGLKGARRAPQWKKR